MSRFALIMVGLICVVFFPLVTAENFTVDQGNAETTEYYLFDESDKNLGCHSVEHCHAVKNFNVIVMEKSKTQYY